MSEDKVVIVTGGTSGIGEGCVRFFHQKGYHVIFCSNAKEQGESLQNELLIKNDGKSHGKPRFIYCDVTKQEDIENLVQITMKEMGRIDCLINNVGYHPEARSIDNFSSGDFLKLIQINVMSYFLFSKFCLPHLRAVKGSIINISSMVSLLGQKHAVTYAATKGAVNAMSKSLAIDEACHGVRVNVVLPSQVDTPLMHSCIKQNAEQTNTTVESLMDRVKKTTLLDRMCTTEEIAQACYFLSDGPKFITGIELPLSGGCELDYGIKL